MAQIPVPLQRFDRRTRGVTPGGREATLGSFAENQRVMPSPFYTLLGATAALALLAGCSSASTATGSLNLPQTRGGSVRDAQSAGGPNARPFSNSRSGIGHPPALRLAPIAPLARVGNCPRAPVAFISDAVNNAVYESNASNAICATFSGPFSYPQGLSVDHHGNVYVANTGAGDIVEFSPTTGQTVNTFSDPGELPSDVAVDGSGNVAVANIGPTSSGTGNVVFYAAGSTSPTGTASSSNFTSPRFCAFDKQGDLDLDDYESKIGVTNVGVVFRGSIHNMTAAIRPLSGASITFPGGVEVLNTSGTYGTLAILDQGSGHGGTIDTYASLVYPNLGPATPTALMNSSDPIGFAFFSGGQSGCRCRRGTRRRAPVPVSVRPRPWRLCRFQLIARRRWDRPDRTVLAPLV